MKSLSYELKATSYAMRGDGWWIQVTYDEDQVRPTETEREILDAILREMRHSASHGAQLTILFDPFTAGRTPSSCIGAHVSFSHGEAGLTHEFNGTIKRSSRPTPAAKPTMHLRARRRS